MQISSAQSSASWSAAAMPDRKAVPAATSQAAAGDEAVPPPSQATADTVSLQGAAAAQAAGMARSGAAGPPPEVFAEIWKDGMKLGVVYTDGEAALPNLPVGGAVGARQPYLRAEEISQRLGGEVRYVNLPALQAAQTRAQLRAAYGG